VMRASGSPCIVMPALFLGTKDRAYSVKKLENRGIE
jgi:hypothetical protein